MNDDLIERSRTLTRNYTDEAEVYERVWAPALRDFVAPLLARLPVSASATLDVGAGVGSLIGELHARFPDASVLGLDRSEGMIGRASDRFGRIVADAQQLPVVADTVDVVTMLFMMFHLPDPPAALAEARRVLRDGGAIATATWGPEEDWHQLDVWHDLLTERGAVPPESVLSRHELVDEPEKIDALLREAGFRDIETWTERFERAWDTDSFLDFATGMAVSKRRLDSLPEAERETFVTEARAELDRLPAGARVLRPSVVFGLARA